MSIELVLVAKTSLEDNPLQAAANLLKQTLAPWRVSIFGDRLHLVLDNPDQEIPQIQAILKTAKIKIYSLRPIPFSLEDAFIGIVQRYENSPRDD